MSFALVRSKGPVRGDGHLLDTKTLRKGIPAAQLLRAQIEAALTGQVKQIDLETGEEIAPARPVTAEIQLKLQQYLLDKRLPTARAEEVEEGPRADLTKISMTPEEIKRMPLSELGRVIEATYERLPNANADSDSATPDSEPHEPADP